MKRAHASGARWIVALAAALALAALLAVSALARSRSPHEHAAAAAPLRVVLYVDGARAIDRAQHRSTRSEHAANRRRRRQEPPRVRSAGLAPTPRSSPWAMPGSARRPALRRRADGDGLGAHTDPRRGADRSPCRLGGRADQRARDLARGLAQISAQRIEARRVRRACRPFAARLRASAALARGSARILARAGDLPRLRPLPVGGQCLVPRHPGRAQLPRGRYVPDSPGLLALGHDRPGSRALAGDVAAGDRAHECVRRAPPDRRFAERLVTGHGDRAERGVALGERLRELSRRAPYAGAGRSRRRRRPPWWSPRRSPTCPLTRSRSRPRFRVAALVRRSGSSSALRSRTAR